MNTISEQEISHVTEGRVCLQPCMGLQLIVIKPSGRVSTESFDVTKINKRAVAWVCTVCLHLEQAFETLLEETKLDTDVEETFGL